MLYLPPRYAHDGLAEACVGGDGRPADCMTYSIGFQAPERGELAGQLLQRLADFSDDGQEGGGQRRLYRDPSQPAVSTPAAVPASLIGFAQEAVAAALHDPLALDCVLGEYLTEPKASLWFDAPSNEGTPHNAGGLKLDPRSRMMYDSHHVFINGESYLAKGADARLMRQLADQRSLALADLRRASPQALDLLADWHASGWLLTAQPFG